jgi:hypothetical protein
VRWPPACEDVRPEAEERPPLEAATKQRDWGHYSVCDSDLWSVVTSCVSKCPVNRITNPNPVYSYSITWQYKFIAWFSTVRTKAMLHSRNANNKSRQNLNLIASLVQN